MTVKGFTLCSSSKNPIVSIDFPRPVEVPDDKNLSAVVYGDIINVLDAVVKAWREDLDKMGGSE